MGLEAYLEGLAGPLRQSPDRAAAGFASLLGVGEEGGAEDGGRAAARLGLAGYLAANHGLRTDPGRVTAELEALELACDPDAESGPGGEVQVELPAAGSVSGAATQGNSRSEDRLEAAREAVRLRLWPTSGRILLCWGGRIG